MDDSRECDLEYNHGWHEGQMDCQAKMDALRAGPECVPGDYALIPVDELLELRREYEELREYYRRVIEEPCAGDEQHCTCVPALRAEIERLRGALAIIAESESAELARCDAKMALAARRTHEC